MVVEHGRAAGQRQLGEAGAGGGVLRLGVDPSPDWVELAEPREQIGLLRARASQRLVQVVVSVDEPRCDERAREIDSLLGVGGSAAADRFDQPFAEEQPAVLVLAAGVVHRRHVRICQQHPAHAPTLQPRPSSRSGFPVL